MPFASYPLQLHDGSSRAVTRHCDRRCCCCASEVPYTVSEEEVAFLAHALASSSVIGRGHLLWWFLLRLSLRLKEDLLAVLTLLLVPLLLLLKALAWCLMLSNAMLLLPLLLLPWPCACFPGAIHFEPSCRMHTANVNECEQASENLRK